MVTPMLQGGTSSRPGQGHDAVIRCATGHMMEGVRRGRIWEQIMDATRLRSALRGGLHVSLQYALDKDTPGIVACSAMAALSWLSLGP